MVSNYEEMANAARARLAVPNLDDDMQPGLQLTLATQALEQGWVGEAKAGERGEQQKLFQGYEHEKGDDEEADET